MLKRMLLLLTLFVIGCGAEAEPTPEIIDVGSPSALQVMFASDDFYVGTPRVPIILFNGVNPAEGVQSVKVTLFDLSEDEAKPVWDGDAIEYADAPMPYWTIAPEIGSAGIWGLEIEAITADNVTETYQRSIEVAEQPRSPAIGSLPPASENRTSATHKLSELSSGINPVDALYDMTVAEALQSDTPTVVLFATPAFCQTRVCAPVVNVAESVQAAVGDAANVIHLEIFEDFQELTNTPEVGEWGLTSEPWTFILDEDGVVTARLGGPISEAELLAELEKVGVE